MLEEGAGALRPRPLAGKPFNVGRFNPALVALSGSVADATGLTALCGVAAVVLGAVNEAPG